MPYITEKEYYTTPIVKNPEPIKCYESFQRGYNQGVIETIMKTQKIMEQTALDILNNRIKLEN